MKQSLFIFRHKRITLFSLMLFIGIRLFSQVHYLGVGESEYIYIRDIPNDGWVVAAAWNPDYDMSPYFTLSEYSSNLPERIKVTINHYFEGVLPVKVFYSYAFWGTYSQRIEVGTTYQTFYFRCTGGGSASLSQSNLQLSVGQSAQLTCNRTMNYGNIKWSSSNPSVASVDYNGKVTAVGIGQTQILCDPIVCNPLKCDVTVSAATPTAINISEPRLSMKVGCEKQLSVNFEPYYANSEIIWSSSNDNIVTVNSMGLVKAIQSGEAIIKARTVDGGCSASSNVYVCPPPTFLIVWFTDGQCLGIDIGQNPEITERNGSVLIYTGNYTYDFDSSTIKKYSLGTQYEINEALGIDKNFLEKSLSFESERINVVGFPLGTKYGLYSISGGEFANGVIKSNSDYIPTNQLPTGTYIIKIHNKSLKFIKK